MNLVRTQVRIPVELVDWLKAKALRDRRSMNGQLVAELIAAKQREQEAA